MRGLVLVCAVSACADAVVIEVTPAPGVPADRVQLFIGLRHCDTCEGIKPPTVNGTAPENGEVLPGDVYFREDSGLATVRREAEVKDGVARFRIEASEIGDRFELAVASDVDHRSAVLIPSLPLDTAGVYKVDLVAAEPNLGPKPTAPTGNFVAVWDQPSGTTPCMGFERWHEGALAQRLFIVPESDPDCDEVVNECNANGYMTVGVPTFDEATCTTSTTLAMESICKLGGEACHDTDGTMIDCAPGDYCLPSIYCDRANNAVNCGGFLEEVDLLNCLFKTPPLARLKCTAPFKPAGVGRWEPCSSISYSVPGSMFGVECVGPFGPLVLALPTDSPSLQFTDTMTYVTDDQTEPLELEAKFRYEYDCEYKLELHGLVNEFAIAGRKLSQTAFVQIWLQRSGGLTRKLLVPLVIEPIDDETCSREGQCTLEVPATDDLVQCVR